MSDDPTAPVQPYAPPRLRPLGSVHELTQASLLGNSGDGLLFVLKGEDLVRLS